jgi:hypothetical protein
MIGIRDLFASGAALRWLTATVTATPGDGTVVVNFRGSSLTLPHTQSYAPAINDVGIILVDGQKMVVIDAYNNPATPVTPRGTATPPTVTPPTAPSTSGAAKTGTSTFLAKQTATWRGGAWRTDTLRPYQGDWAGYGIGDGYWFYGTAVKDALVGATVTAARFYFRRMTGGDFAAHPLSLYLHGTAVKGSSAPARIGSVYDTDALAVGKAAWVAIPASFGQALVDGTARGITCHIAGSSPYVVTASLSDTGSAGALKLTWRK